MSQCPHGLELLRYVLDQQELMRTGFNALTGLSCYVTYTEDLSSVAEVSMPSRAYTSFLRRPERMYMILSHTCFNALTGLYLISTVPLQKPRFYAISRACFCRYLSEYSDNSHFSCMLTFWTYLMRCTYPWHWIKYSTKYNRCHPIFSLSWQVELSSNTLSSRATAQTSLCKM